MRGGHKKSLTFSYASALSDKWLRSSESHKIEDITPTFYSLLMVVTTAWILFCTEGPIMLLAIERQNNFESIYLMPVLLLLWMMQSGSRSSMCIVVENGRETDDRALG